MQRPLRPRQKSPQDTPESELDSCSVDEDVIIVVLLPAGKIVLQVSKGTVQAACQPVQKLKSLYFNKLTKLNFVKPCKLQEMRVEGGRYAISPQTRCASPLACLG